MREGIRELDEREKRKKSLFVRGISARYDGEFTETFKHVCRSITDNNITLDSVFASTETGSCTEPNCPNLMLVTKFLHLPKTCGKSLSLALCS